MYLSQQNGAFMVPKCELLNAQATEAWKACYKAVWAVPKREKWKGRELTGTNSVQNKKSQAACTANETSSETSLQLLWCLIIFSTEKEVKKIHWHSGVNGYPLCYC